MGGTASSTGLEESMTPLQFRRRVRSDIEGAQIWYESRDEDLGARFASSVTRCLQLITEHPLMYQRVSGDVRRAPVRDFPYSVFYRVESDAIVVIACYHASRDPSGWQR